MKNKYYKVYLLILTVFIFLNSFNRYAYATEENNSKLSSAIEQSQDLCEQALINMLYPYILNSIQEYYGGERQFDLFDAKIIKIQRPSEKYEFTIVAQIDTYTGAHNPPGGPVIITIQTSPYGTKVTNITEK